ncbi:polynucleotide adenylyltransferase PcnB [Agitococcus lubricus]|uniref:Poly(A) polymerase I n=1 Tax=Agitococcus lubricus TaxID=1077255 RepID=A0A2T5IVJ8_9GAMM|nr:polynucleotide adenylyltransferase PcnB [Agitococcus lubricus]PTQ87841.1 poly(A) polymerase [Agitococcus lubricus]
MPVSSSLRTYQAAHYGIHPNQLSEGALATIHSLVSAGFQAFVVGGGVRDLLLGLHPKDFDIATNATPEQIKRIFGRHCQIIGRRFQLAHVYHGRHLLEVATFRAPHQEQSSHSQTSAHGMIVRDNVWGTIEQDASRRDFSANALYYQPQTGLIWDFANGMSDIEQKTLRMIGDAPTRYREDPVRMLRAARFAAKLGFSIDDASLAPIPSLAYLLKAISPHRLYDESHKLFCCGHLQQLLPLLQNLGLLQHLFPFIDEGWVHSTLIQIAAKNTDDRLQQGKSVNPAFFYAILLWQWQQQLTQLELAKGEDLFPALQNAGIKVLNLQAQHTAIPRFVGQTIREIWDLQPRLAQPKARIVPKLISQPRFRAGFDFLWLREQAGDDSTLGMGSWWEHYQQVSVDEQEHLLKLLDRRKAKAVAQEKATKKSHSKKGKAKKTSPKQDIATDAVLNPDISKS